MINYLMVKPIVVNSLIGVSNKKRLMIVLEEHVTASGFGSAISEVLAPLLNRSPLIMMGVKEGFITVGTFMN
jgi:transketolase C-terminal domain/subunit